MLGTRSAILSSLRITVGLGDEEEALETCRTMWSGDVKSQEKRTEVSGEF